MTAVLLGAIFGFFLAWGRLSDPDVIRRMLLLQQAYLFLLLASAVAVGFVGVRVLRASRARTLVTREPIRWALVRPERRHVGGAALFGLGWAIACTCPGPVVAQAASGVGWSAAVIAGMFLGVKLRLVQQRRPGIAKAAPKGGLLPSSMEPVAGYQMAASVSGSKK